MSKFYIGQQKEEPITEIVWLNKNDEEEYIEMCNNHISIGDSSECDSVLIHKTDIPKLEAALAKARELGWFE